MLALLAGSKKRVTRMHASVGIAVLPGVLAVAWYRVHALSRWPRGALMHAISDWKQHNMASQGSPAPLASELRVALGRLRYARAKHQSERAAWEVAGPSAGALFEAALTDLARERDDLHALVRARGEVRALAALVASPSRQGLYEVRCLLYLLQRQPGTVHGLAARMANRTAVTNGVTMRECRYGIHCAGWIHGSPNHRMDVVFRFGDHSYHNHNPKCPNGNVETQNI